MNYQAIALWSQVLSAILFLVVLIWLVQKYLIPAIIKAQEQKNAELASAEQRRDEAKASIEDARRQVTAADADAIAIRARIKSEAEHDRERALADAKESGERSVRNAQGELARARVNASDALRVDMIEEALQLARRKANESIDSASNAQLVDRFVGTLERENAGERSA